MEIIDTGQNHIVVLDEFLPAHELALIYREFQREKFGFINSTEFYRAYNLYDGHPLRGKDRTLSCPCSADPTISIRKEKPIESLLSVVAFHISSMLEMTMNKSKQLQLVASTFVYPSGTSLAWHDDGGVLCAFIYYVHQRWRPEWGGELLVSSTRLDLDKARGIPIDDTVPLFEDPLVAECVSRAGVGTYLLPKPNRLILLKAGWPHTIKKVDPAAGNNVRCTISGFAR